MNTRQDAVRVLLELYRQREDLQRAHPEVQSGDYRRLVQWAAGVSSQKWFDPAHSVLHRYERWYSPEYNLHLVQDSNPAASFKTWEQAGETLEDAELRIHDGVPHEMLHVRADAYVNNLGMYFPDAMPAPGSLVLEVGSGVGYIMEAVYRKFKPRSLIGLDVAPHMVVNAQQRFARDKVTMPANFVVYDGVTIPIRSGAVDFIYSVACLQHVPKPYVYNLFGEMLRTLKIGGFAALHFLSFTALKLGGFNFRREIAHQLLGMETHWHHFYSTEELSCVLQHGYGAGRMKVVDTQDGSIWTSFAR